MEIRLVTCPLPFAMVEVKPNSFIMITIPRDLPKWEVEAAVTQIKRMLEELAPDQPTFQIVLSYEGCGVQSFDDKMMWEMGWERRTR